MRTRRGTLPHFDLTTFVDLGLKHFAVLCTGEKVEHPRHLEKHLTRLKVLQRRLSRRQKGSANYRKARLKVALLHPNHPRKPPTSAVGMKGVALCERRMVVNVIY